MKIRENCRTHRLLWFLCGMILFLLILLCLQVYYKLEQKRKLFNDYIEKYNKTYKDDLKEYELRFRHFKASLDEISRLNQDPRVGAKYGLTYLSDLSKTEFKDIHLSDEKIQLYPKNYNFKYGRIFNLLHTKNTHHKVYERRKRDADLPLEFDWRKMGVIGPVKNQGICGACWAFSTVNTIEAMAAMKTGKLETLSVQEAVDCARGGNTGCSGGDICLLLNWLYKTQTPLEREIDYPLRLMDGTCKRKSNATGVRVKGFSCESMIDNEKKILEQIATVGPVAVAVNAISWQHYVDGVIQYHCSGRIMDLNHAVQIVGYNLNAEVPYYIAKNSWGKEFGQNGYLKLAIGENICGLANEVAGVDILL